MPNNRAPYLSLKL